MAIFCLFVLFLTSKRVLFYFYAYIFWSHQSGAIKRIGFILLRLCAIWMSTRFVSRVKEDLCFVLKNPIKIIGGKIGMFNGNRVNQT